ncbi:MAG TPA: tripartite tricarboxylate transporter substrate-binding protein [Euzebya sp.]|nr:tripartite tricarboxylate transporter substrate-binding protein [Euzebya sp.]
MPARRIPLTTTLIVLIALLLAACGGADTGATTSVAEEEPAADPATEVEAGADDPATEAEEPAADPAAEVEPYGRLAIMAPADPGGGWDGTARAMARVIEDTGLAGSTVVTNVGGAGGTVGLAQLANETSEEFLMVSGLVMVGAIETNQSQATLEDVTPIARLTAEDEVLVVPADSEHTDLDSFVQAWQEQGGAVTITGGSAGGTDHIVAGLLAAEAGIPIEDVNYIAYSGGGESLAALLGSQVDAGISGVSEYAEQIAAGELVPLAVTGAERVDGIDAPTMTEAGYDVELSNWRAVVAPGSISPEAADRLVATMTAMRDSPEWQAQLETNGWSDVFLAGEEFATFLDEEVVRITAVLTDLGLIT